MIAMIFEFWFDRDDPAAFEAYLAESHQMRERVAHAAGFLGIERFESTTEPGKFVAIGFFTDETAVAAWRNTPEHRRAQAHGRRRYFTNYRLRMATVTRDYGPEDRAEAPVDSQAVHG